MWDVSLSCELKLGNHSDPIFPHLQNKESTMKYIYG